MWQVFRRRSSPSSRGARPAERNERSSGRLRSGPDGATPRSTQQGPEVAASGVFLPDDSGFEQASLRRRIITPTRPTSGSHMLSLPGPRERSQLSVAENRGRIPEIPLLTACPCQKLCSCCKY
jgi:hypothetical protein